MIFPIGHEEQTVRRLPWVTFAIIAANFVAFLTVGMKAEDVDRRIVQIGQEVMEYWQHHPYLDLPKDFIDATVPDAQREHFDILTEAVKIVPPPEDPEQREREQAWLEQLVQRFHAAVAAQPYFRWGLIPNKFHLAALFTCMFMHAGWLHLLGNMFIFYLAGPPVEDAYGRPLFAGLYLIGGALASVVHVAAFPDSNVPLVGASGAVAVVMGAFLIRYARTKIRFFYWFAWVFRGTFSAPAYVMLPLWLLEQLWLGGLTKGGDGVAYWAHVGGFVIGATVAWGLKRTKVEERYIHPRIEAQITLSQDPALEEGMRLLSEQSPVAAREAFAKALAVDQRNPDANLGTWESFVQENRHAEGVAYLVRVIEHELRAGERGLALDHWRELSAAGGTLPGTMRWRLACELQDDHADLAREVLEDLAGDASAGLLTAKAAGRLVDLAKNDAERQRWQALSQRLEAAPPGSSAGVLQAAEVQEQAVTAAAATSPAQAASMAAGVGPPAFETSGGAPFAPPEGARVAVRRVDRRVLRKLDDGGLVVSSGDVEEHVPFDEVATVAVAAVADAARPYLVTDLVLHPGADGTRRVLRFLSSELDPRGVLARPDLAPLAAFRALLKLLVLETRATVLPAASVLHDTEFTTFPSLAEYERQVLGEPA